MNIFLLLRYFISDTDIINCIFPLFLMCEVYILVQVYGDGHLSAVSVESTGEQWVLRSWS